MIKFDSISRLLLFALFVALLSSCVKEPSVSGVEWENKALHAWVKKNHPELVGNRQSYGDYYVDILEWGDENLPADDTDEGKINDFGGMPIREQDTVWLIYNLTGSDLQGNVFINRSATIARMLGTFTLHTHYAPHMNFSGKDNIYSLLESNYRLARNEITLSRKYVDERFPGRDTLFSLRAGSKVRIYTPSTIAYGASGSSETGGYEGQFVLDSNVPAILELEVLRAIKNPAKLEMNMITSLVGATDSESDGENGWKIVLSDKADSSPENDGSDQDEEQAKLAGLFYNNNWAPGSTAVPIKYLQSGISDLTSSHPYTDAMSDCYGDMAALDARIAEILDERFGEQTIAIENQTSENLIKKDQSVSVWYITRLLDGYIVDTNITELRKILFDDTTTSSALSFKADDNEMVSSWGYAIPNMYYGTWGLIACTSGYAYGGTGRSGQTTTTTSGGVVAVDPMFDYYNSMYYPGYYGYGGYGYGYGYGYDYYNPYFTSTTTTTTTSSDTSTEILPYTPMLFYIFVEPQD